MSNNSDSLMKKIEDRISTLLGTSTPKEDLNDMYRLQKEHAPHLTYEEAQDYVIQGLIQTYDDRQLDHLWYQLKNELENGSVKAA